MLRQEKKISQRKASGDLGVSQALLSHYEKGVREPGLSFVVRVADYYGVSVDYLLGRTMSRDGAAILAEDIHDDLEEKGNVLKGSAAAMLTRKLLVNSVAMLYDILSRCGSKKLIAAVNEYLSISVYKMFRMVHSMDKASSSTTFSTAEVCYSQLADARLKVCEGKILRVGDNLKKEPVNLPDMSLDNLAQHYPQLCPSLLSVLHNVSEKLDREMGDLS